MIEHFIREHGRRRFKIVTKRRIPGRPDLPDVDICLIDESNSEMMIVEFKWTLPPADPWEIIDKMEIEEKALAQIKALSEYSKANEAIIGELMGSDCLIPKERMYFLIVVKDFVGTARNFDSHFPEVHYQVFDRLMKSGTTLHEIAHHASERTFLPNEGVDYKTVAEEYVIDKYRVFWTGWMKNR